MSVFSWLSWDNPVSIWWVALSAASVCNILFWFWTWRFGFKGKTRLNIATFLSETTNVIVLSSIYVFVCAFRSFFPRADVQRICLFDSWLSSVFLGRFIATFAELAFVAQWALVIRFLARETKTNTSLKISYLIIPTIFMAECFSWYAVIRTHYLGNAVEESLWAVTYSAIILAILSLLPKLKGALKLAAQFSILGCIGYVAFMVTVDVPMYIGRLISDNQKQKPLLGFIDGLIDLNTRWIVTHSIMDWKSEIPWQTLYFSFAVLVSIALCYVPLKTESLKKYLT